MIVYDVWASVERKLRGDGAGCRRLGSGTSQGSIARRYMGLGRFVSSFKGVLNYVDNMHVNGFGAVEPWGHALLSSLWLPIYSLPSVCP